MELSSGFSLGCPPPAMKRKVSLKSSSQSKWDTPSSTSDKKGMTNWDSTPSFRMAKVKEDESYCQCTDLPALYRTRILDLILSLCSPWPKFLLFLRSFKNIFYRIVLLSCNHNWSWSLGIWRPKATGFSCRICYLVNRLLINLIRLFALGWPIHLMLPALSKWAVKSGVISGSQNPNCERKYL